MKIDEYRFFSAERGGVCFSWTASPAPEVDPAYKNWVERISSRADFEIREITDQFEKLELAIYGILNECYNQDCDLTKEAQAAIADVCSLLKQKQKRIN